MSSFTAGKVKSWEKFVEENLKEYGIEKGSHFEAKLWVAYEDMSNIFKTAEHQLRYKIKNLEEEIERLKFVEKKWNCECCRLMYDRGGCPDHGPCLT